jgi:hypothetical protein
MTTNDNLENYAALLRIRYEAGRRNTAITGILFLLSVMGFFANGLLGDPSDRATILIGILVLALGLTYLTTWVRLEIARSLIECVDHLQRPNPAR